MTNDPMKEFVKPIVGILTSRKDVLDDVLARLGVSFGRPDVVGAWREFSHSDYYADEMGPDLSRCFVSFDGLVRPEAAREFKPITQSIEAEYSLAGKRTVNLDAGYLDANKVVLVSGKQGGHKIAIADGAWVDLLLWYNKGWEAMPWAFPDFRDGGYFRTFTRMRTAFKKQVRASRDQKI